MFTSRCVLLLLAVALTSAGCTGYIDGGPSGAVLSDSGRPQADATPVAPDAAAPFVPDASGVDPDAGAQPPVDPCAALTCGANAHCASNRAGANCICNAGFQDTGAGCTAIPVNPCNALSCAANAHCLSNGATADCVCNAGYHDAGAGCVPVTCDGVSCGTNRRCVISAGRPVCTCKNGFFEQDGSCVAASCNGVDCGSPKARCVQGPHGFACRCKEGYYDPWGAVAQNPGNGDRCMPAAGTACEGVECGGHGECTLEWGGGGAGCICDPGYLRYGNSCVPWDRVACWLPEEGHYTYRGGRRCDSSDRHIETCADHDGDGDVEWGFGANCFNVEQNPGQRCSDSCLGNMCGDSRPLPPGIEQAQECGAGTVCIRGIHTEVGQPGEIWACGGECDCSNCARKSFGFSAACETQDGQPLVCNKPCGPGYGCLPFRQQVCFPGEGYLSAPPDG